MKRIIKLNESDVHRIIKETVSKVIQENAIDYWRQAEDKYLSRERLPKGWEKIERENDAPIYRDPDFNEFVKDEYGRLVPVTESKKIGLQEGIYGFPDECDQIILAYQNDRECMGIYDDIVKMLLKKVAKGIELNFDLLVNSSVLKKFQQFVFRKFKQFQDTPMTRNTPYIFREYVAKRMLEQIANGEFSLKK